MNRVFFYPLRLLLPVFFSITSSLHAEEPEELSDVEVQGILAAQQAAGATTLSQKKLFRASNGDDGDYFQAVAISGDTVVIGAPFEDSNASGVNGSQSNNSLIHSGAAYVYVRKDDKWTQQAYLKASNPGRNDQFGFAVAISGNTIAIGAFGEDSKSSTQTDNAAENAGAVYIFTRTGTTWTQQAYLKSSTAAAGNLFGYSVALSDSSLVVGAMGESGGSSSGTDTSTSIERAGAAYVFTRTTTTWTQQASLKASNPGANDLFGVSVGISGDTVVVGAQNESSDSTGVNGVENDDTQSNSGAAYVFVRSEDNKWTKQAYLKASNTAKNDLFGHSVAISGRTIVVGAHQESSNARGVNKNQSDNSASKSGAAYVFIRDGKKWQQQAYLKASNTGAGDAFGYSVAVSGASVLVGAYGEDSKASAVQGNQTDNSAADSGAAYLFTRSGTKWTQKSYLKASNTAKDNQFGTGAAIDDNVAVVSASGFDKNAGAAYLFAGDTSPSPEIAIEKKNTDGTFSNLLISSASVAFEPFKLGSASPIIQTFKVRNTGIANLNKLAVTKSGTGSSYFTVVPAVISTSVPPGGSIEFNVEFSDSGSISTTRTAEITIKSNDLDEPEFKIALTADGLSGTLDRDDDNLNDYAEAKYAALGFDWKIKNTALVKTLRAGALDSGIFQDVKVSTPVLTKDATTGKFTLSLAVEKSTDLKTFTPLSLSLQGTTATETTFTGGILQLKFTSSEKAEFYRVLAK